MKEKAAAVVEYVFAVVGCVEYGSGNACILYFSDDLCQQAVGVSNGIVVGIEQLGAVGGFGLAGVIGAEVRHCLGVSLAVFEV